MNIPRIQIAADVLQQIALGKFIPETGDTVNWQYRTVMYDALPMTPAKELLQQELEKSPCRVCLKGSLVLAHVLRFNHETIIGLRGLLVNDATPALPEFPTKLLSEMEVLFEGRAYNWNRTSLTEEEIYKLKAFAAARGLPKLDDSARLVRILSILLSNLGEYVCLKPSNRCRRPRP